MCWKFTMTFNSTNLCCSCRGCRPAPPWRAPRPTLAPSCRQLGAGRCRPPPPGTAAGCARPAPPASPSARTRLGVTTECCRLVIPRTVPCSRPGRSRGWAPCGGRGSAGGWWSSSCCCSGPTPGPYTPTPCIHFDLYNWCIAIISSIILALYLFLFLKTEKKTPICMCHSENKMLFDIWHPSKYLDEYYCSLKNIWWPLGTASVTRWFAVVTQLIVTECVLTTRRAGSLSWRARQPPPSCRCSVTFRGESWSLATRHFGGHAGSRGQGNEKNENDFVCVWARKVFVNFN